MIDFYDSFTYNLAHYLEAFDVELMVKRYDQLDAADFLEIKALVLSPGPGLPKEKAGLTSMLNQNVGKIPIVGVCLGMQALAEHLGGQLKNQEEVKHGVAEAIFIQESPVLFKNLPQEIEVGLYHSWRVECPDSWITAQSATGVPMAIELPDSKVFGVQFHPESIMTPFGKQILHNFLKNC